MAMAMGMAMGMAMIGLISMLMILEVTMDPNHLNHHWEETMALTTLIGATMMVCMTLIWEEETEEEEKLKMEEEEEEDL